MTDRSDTDGGAAGRRSAADRARFARLVELFDRAVELPPAARQEFVAEACSDDQDLRRELVALLERADAANGATNHLAGHVEELAASALAGSTRSPARPERIGGYRILDVLGEGGMGVVFRAEQEQPRRQVALKVLRTEHLFFPGALRRFEREAAALAGAKHPGIVAIHAFGEDSGVPFLAMEWVEGRSLADLLRDLGDRSSAELTGHDLARAIEPAADDVPGARPRNGTRVPALFEGNWTQCCLRIAAQLADALEAAHGHGVLHRDVKPSNVMLTRDGRVVLIDFGIARTVDAAGVLSTVTAIGCQPGSLAYMSPEQLRGEPARVDRRTDVYSLGVTLYEMLSLRGPFADETADATRQRILEGRFPPLRKRIPTVSWEAEVVCQTAMERSAARRYATAAALREDLENVLALRPIRARRWIQRRPAATVAVTMGLLLVSVLPTALLLQEQRSRGAIEGKQIEAEANLVRALDVVDRMLVEVGDRQLAHVPQVERLRRELLEDALSFYGEFVSAGTPSDRLQVERAWAQTRLGVLQIELGEPEAGLERIGSACAAFAELAARDADDERLRARRWQSELARADALEVLGRTDDAESHLKHVLALATRAGSDAPIASRAEEELVVGIALNRLCALELDRLQHEEALALGERARATLADPEPDDRRLDQSALAEAQLGQALLGLQRFELAEPHLRRAVEIRDELAEHTYRSPADRARQVDGIADLAVACLMSSRLTEGEELARRALQMGESLRVAFPSMLWRHWSVVEAQASLGFYLIESGRSPEEGTTYLTRAVESGSTLLARAEPTPRGLALMQSVRSRFAKHLRATRPADAERELRESLALAAWLGRDFPHARRRPLLVAETGMELANLLHRQQRWEEARETYRGLLRRLRTMVDRRGPLPEILAMLCGAEGGLGDVESELGGESMPHRRRAMAIALELCRDHPDHASGAPALDRAGRCLAQALVDANRLADACGAIEQSISASVQVSRAASPTAEAAAQRCASHPAVQLGRRLLASFAADRSEDTVPALCRSIDAPLAALHGVASGHAGEPAWDAVAHDLAALRGELAAVVARPPTSGH